MKNLTIRLIVALLAFAAGTVFTITVRGLTGSVGPTIPEQPVELTRQRATYRAIDICKLTGNSELYVGRLVRLRTRVVRADRQTLDVVDWKCTMGVGVRTIQLQPEEADRISLPILNPYSTEVSDLADVEIVGFVARESDGSWTGKGLEIFDVSIEREFSRGNFRKQFELEVASLFD